MDHHHDHHHHHHHEGEALSFDEKMRKMFEHWIKHNQSHAETYLDWAHKAEAAGMAETAGLLKDIAAMADEITKKLGQGAETVK